MGEEGTRIMTPAERRDLDHRLYESGLPDLGIFPELSNPYLPEVAEPEPLELRLCPADSICLVHCKGV
jgi:hypothetical protein